MRPLFCLAMPAFLMAQNQADPPSPAEEWKRIEIWAGPDAADLGFTREKVAAFLAARKADFGAGRQEPWATWLKGLSAAKLPSMRAWALSRRLESGDFSAFPNYRHLLSEHLFGISKPGSGRTDDIIAEPWGGLPSPLRIAPASSFWQGFTASVQKIPEFEMDSSLYAVWCYGTAPSQRDLILGVASWVKPSVKIQNKVFSPWNDPRFWIVADWAIAWGTRVDFEAIHQCLPEGRARMEFEKIQRQLETVPRFWDAPRENSLLLGEGSVKPAEENEAVQKPIRLFKPLKIAKMPPPPPYPDEAKSRRMMDTVVVSITVEPDGSPAFARLLPGPWLTFFGPTALGYAMTWRFDPPQVSGQAIPLRASFRLTMPFRLR